MDFTFSAEQVMMRDTVARYLERDYRFEQRQTILRSPAGMSEDVWRRLETMGLFAMPLPEVSGGLNGTPSDIVAVAELLGRYLVVEPYFSSVLLAGRALARAEKNSIALSWLGRIITAESRAALAHEEGHGTASVDTIETTARLDGDCISISGEKRLVIDGADADILVVTARSGANRLALVVVEPRWMALRSRRCGRLTVGPPPTSASTMLVFPRKP